MMKVAILNATRREQKKVLSKERDSVINSQKQTHNLYMENTKTQSTTKALFDYTLSSSKINEYLREFSYSPLQSRQVKLIKKALNKTKLPLPMIVQRGIETHPQLQKLLNIEPKQINNINLPLLNNNLKKKPIILKEKALHSYTSSFHAPINTGIGGAKGNLNEIDDKYKHTVQTITIMDEKMKQCPVASDIIVFRGESINVFGLILGLKKKEQDEIRHALGRGFPQDFINKMNTNYSGKIITRHSFTSCGIAEGKGFTANSHPIQLRIAVPKGTLGIYAEPFSAYGLGDKLDWDGYSKQKDFSQEDEIILNRGLKMHIIKFATNGIALYVHAEIIP